MIVEHKLVAAAHDQANKCHLHLSTSLIWAAAGSAVTRVKQHCLVDVDEDKTD